MTAELVPVQNMADVEALDPAAREVAVTHMLGEARTWLAHAVETTGPARIAEFKAWVATVAETTRQLQLSREIQLDAQEMVRRAERGVGLAIRKGQADGTVTRERAHGRNQVSRDHQVDPAPSSPAEFAKQSELSGSAQDKPGMYALADGVTDEQFDQAIEDAKGEGNLSRANVVRKFRSEGPKAGSRPEVLRRTRHIDPFRVISETVYALDGLSIGVGLLEPHHFDGLAPADVDAWASSLTESLRSLNRLNRQLKELNQA